MPQRGRPSKLNKKVQDRIVSAIERGAYIETAAAAAGINKTTFYDWLKQGARLVEQLEKGDFDLTEKESALVNFSNAVEKAIADSEMRDVQVIDSAAQSGQWQAAAWRLERKNHARWGRKLAVTDDKGGNFFDGMARAWARALDEDGTHGEPRQLTNGSGKLPATNGNGRDSVDGSG